MDLKLHWLQCQGDVWCKLSTVNLDHAHFDGLRGVYVIWHGGAQPRTVLVGSGIIRDRIAFHRMNPAVQHFAALTLFVTWASVVDSSQLGVERYLAQQLKPTTGSDHASAALPISVNLPWS